MLKNPKKLHLKHYGVKGMQWGVVKKENLSSAESRLPRINKLKDRTEKEIIDDKKNRVINFDQIPRFNPKNESINTAITKVNEGYSYSPLFTNDMVTKYGLESWRGGVLDFTNNCPSASFSYELRRRGLDVEAGLTGGATLNEIATAFNISDEEMEKAEEEGTPPKTLEQLTAELKLMGPGARGFCIMFWTGGGGHISSFEINEKGEVVFIDAQSQLSSQGPIPKGKINPADYSKRADTYFTLRVDNRKMNSEVLKDWVRLDDKTTPKGSEQLKYLDPNITKKAKDFIQHSKDILLVHLIGKD